MRKVLVCWRRLNGEIEFYIMSDIGPNYLKLLRSLSGLYLSSLGKDAIFAQDIIRLQDRLKGSKPIYSDSEVPDSVVIQSCHELVVTGE